MLFDLLEKKNDAVSWFRDGKNEYLFVQIERKMYPPLNERTENDSTHSCDGCHYILWFHEFFQLFQCLLLQLS